MTAVVADVKARSGATLRWQRDETARQENAEAVRRILRRPLTAASAVQVALLDNRALQATLEDVGIALADFREAGYLTNPVLNFNPQFPDHTPRSPELDYGISTSLLDALFIPLRKRLTAGGLAAAKARVADAALRLVADVKVAYYEVVADGQIFIRLRTIADAANASLLLSQRQFEAGNITDVALGLAQTEYSQVRLELGEVEAKGREDREKLNRLMGVYGPDTDWTPESALPKLPESDPPAAGLETLAISQRFDLAASRRNFEGALQQAGIARSYRFLTQLDVGIGGQRDVGNGPNQVGPNLTVQVPLFNGGQARIARNEAALRQAQRAFEGMAIDARAEVRELRDRLDARRQTVRFYETDVLPFQRRLLAGQQLQYNAMIVSPFELFRTRIDQLSAERRYIETQKEYWQTRAELERAVGGSFQKTPVGKSVVEKK